MSQTMEDEYESNESESSISWIWSKVPSGWKKVLKIGVVVALSPLLLPPLVVASTIAVISAVPFCLFLANYACTQKLMRSLLPDTEERGGIETEESGLLDRKLGHGSGTSKAYGTEPLMATNETILNESEEDEELAKESTSLIERIRDEGRSDRGVSRKDDEKAGNDKSEKVQDQYGKQEEAEIGREGQLGGTTNENFTGKDAETSNEPIEKAVSPPRGTGEEKRKNTTKKKKKTGRAGVQ